YEAGFDKVVRVWTLDPATGRFVLDRAAYRVPIGPGYDGAINALALSPDENWLAVGGLGAGGGRGGFPPSGVVASSKSMSNAMRLDEGTIYLFHTKKRDIRRLRGHRGAVLALAFAPAHQGKAPLLVSTAQEPDDAGNEVGVLRLWNVDKGEELAHMPLAKSYAAGFRPELLAWHTGKELRQVRVVTTSADPFLRLWDVGEKKLWEEPADISLGVAYHSGKNQVLTAGYQQGRLQWGNMASGAPPPPQADPLPLHHTKTH